VLVRRHVDRAFARFCGHPLPDRRSVDEAENSVGEGAGFAQLIAAWQAGGYGEIPDALAGDRLTLGPGDCGDGARDVHGSFGHFAAIEDERAVRFVAEHRDLGPAQNGFELIEHARRVHDAGRVIGRVQDERLGARREGGGYTGRIGQKVFRGLDLDDAPRVILDIEPVLGEVRHKHHHFVAGIEHRFEHGVERAARTHGHDDVPGVVRKARSLREPARDDFAHLGIARVRHVAVTARPVFRRDAGQRRRHLFRGLHLGIAQREIKDVFRAALCPETVAFLKHPADPRRPPDLLSDASRNNHRSMRLYTSTLSTTLMPAS